MKIAIIGSRDFGDKSLVDETLFNELTRQNDVVITGGANGVDTWVKEFCKMNALNALLKFNKRIDPRVRMFASDNINYDNLYFKSFKQH